MDRTIATFQKNKFQQIHVGVREFKGNDLIDIRVWTQVQGGDHMVATAKGVSMNIHLVPELRKALEQVEATLKQEKML